MEGDGDEISSGNAEIDMSAPFRSVKEAVSLFGEKVLAGELHANKLKQIKASENVNVDDPAKQKQRAMTLTAELEITKQSLQKAKEESMIMENSLSSLQAELERTKLELQKLKQPFTEIEEDERLIIEVNRKQRTEEDNDVLVEEGVEFQEKRYVSFAANTNTNGNTTTKVLEPQEVVKRHTYPSPKNIIKKKKPLIPLPLLGGIFSKKK